MFSRLALSILLALSGMGALSAAELPRKSAEFAIQLPDGKEALVSQYRGNVLCLVFVLSS
ncbi:MAG TPA: hypothetical protein VKG25_26040 [Bryobacteraceae bacterium]|nr:hypothetical protein [Bryobacteraceae bacterium]